MSSWTPKMKPFTCHPHPQQCIISPTLLSFSVSLIPPLPHCPSFPCWLSYLQPDSDPPSVSQELVLQAYAVTSSNTYFCHLNFGRSVKNLIILCVKIYMDVHFYGWIYVCNSFIVVVVRSKPRAENTLGKLLPSSLKESFFLWLLRQDFTKLSQRAMKLLCSPDRAWTCGSPCLCPRAAGIRGSYALLIVILSYDFLQWNSYSDTWHEKSIQDFGPFWEEIKFFLEVTKSLGRLFIIQKPVSPWLSHDEL